MADEPKGATAKAEDKLSKEMEEVMPLVAPKDEGLPFEEREPEKVVPHKDDDGADTPSGAALMAVGAPSQDPEEIGGDAERVKGMKYRLAKYKKRWLS